VHTWLLYTVCTVEILVVVVNARLYAFAQDFYYVFYFVFAVCLAVCQDRVELDQNIWTVLPESGQLATMDPVTDV